jgi:hypothetical protein
MSQDPQDTANQPYPLRLPNYRSSHQGRYHPYPTFNRQQGTSTNEYDDVEIAVRVLFTCVVSLAKRRSIDFYVHSTQRAWAIYTTRSLGRSASVLLDISPLILIPLLAAIATSR